MTTIGDLVVTLFDEYERMFHDDKLAALMTQAALEDLLRDHAEATERLISTDIE